MSARAARTARAARAVAGAIVTGVALVLPCATLDAQAERGLALVVAGSVGHPPSRVTGGIVDRRLGALTLEWLQPIAGSARGGVTWSPALHPVLSMSRVPTVGALIYYDCASVFQATSEPCSAQWSERATARAVALEPLSVRAWRRVGPVTLAVRPGIGAALFPRAVPIPEGRRVNALLRLDASASVAIGARDALLVQYGWWHISNAGSAPLNPGVDALQLQVGVLRRFGAR